MDRAAVVALREVLDRRLPVGVMHRWRLEYVGQAFRLGCPHLDLGAKAGVALVEGRCVVVQVHKDGPGDDIGTNRPEPELFGIEAVNTGGVGGVEERSVERVRPRVVRAREPTGVAALFDHEVTTMTTDVVECADLAVVAVCDQHLRTENRLNGIVARHRHVRDVADAHPASSKDPVALLVEHVGRRVGPVREPGLQCLRLVVSGHRIERTVESRRWREGGHVSRGEVRCSHCCQLGTPSCGCTRRLARPAPCT